MEFIVSETLDTLADEVRSALPSILNVHSVDISDSQFPPGNQHLKEQLTTNFLQSPWGKISNSDDIPFSPLGVRMKSPWRFSTPSSKSPGSIQLSSASTIRPSPWNKSSNSIDRYNKNTNIYHEHGDNDYNKSNNIDDVNINNNDGNSSYDEGNDSNELFSSHNGNGNGKGNGNRNGSSNGNGNRTGNSNRNGSDSNDRNGNRSGNGNRNGSSNGNGNENGSDSNDGNGNGNGNRSGNGNRNGSDSNDRNGNGNGNGSNNGNRNGNRNGSSNRSSNGNGDGNFNGNGNRSGNDNDNGNGNGNGLIPQDIAIPTRITYSQYSTSTLPGGYYLRITFDSADSNLDIHKSVIRDFNDMESKWDQVQSIHNVSNDLRSTKERTKPSLTDTPESILNQVLESLSNVLDLCTECRLASERLASIKHFR